LWVVCSRMRWVKMTQFPGVLVPSAGIACTSGFLRTCLAPHPLISHGFKMVGPRRANELARRLHGLQGRTTDTVKSPGGLDPPDDQRAPYTFILPGASEHLIPAGRYELGWQVDPSMPMDLEFAHGLTDATQVVARWSISCRSRVVAGLRRVGPCLVAGLTKQRPRLTAGRTRQRIRFVWRQAEGD